MVYYNRNPELKQVIDMIQAGFFSNGDKETFKNVTDMLLNHDRFLTLADYESYITAQDQVSNAYQNSALWAKMAIHNIVSSGKFSSDRTIAEYAREIWGVEPTHSKLPGTRRRQGRDLSIDLTAIKIPAFKNLTTKI